MSCFLVGVIGKFAGALGGAAHFLFYPGGYFFTAVALVAAVPPLYDGVIELRTYGGYIETFVLMLLLLLAALRLTQRWQAGASNRGLGWRWAGFGLLVGFGMWIYPLIVSAVLAAAIWILGKGTVEIIKGRQCIPSGTKHTISNSILYPARGLLLAAAAIPAALVGFAPGIYWGITHQWTNITYIVGLGGGGSISHRLQIIQRVALGYTTCVAPRVISGALPTESKVLAAIHSPLLIVGAFCLLVPAGLVLISLLWHQAALLRVRQLAALPLLFGACSALILFTNKNSVLALISCGYDPVGRYATPLLLVLPFAFATIFTVVCMFIHERGKPQGQIGTLTNGVKPSSSKNVARLSLLGQSLVFVLLIVYLGAQAWTYGVTEPGYTFQSPYCHQAPANDDAIIAYLQQQHIHYACAINWIAYSIVFKTDEKIIVSDPMPFIPPVVNYDRIPPNSITVRHADRPSLLVFVNHSDPYPPLLRALDDASVTYKSARFPTQPDTHVLVSTPLRRTVSPFEAKAITSQFHSCIY